MNRMAKKKSKKNKPKPPSLGPDKHVIRIDDGTIGKLQAKLNLDPSASYKTIVYTALNRFLES
jgi:hypothetical protein